MIFSKKKFVLVAIIGILTVLLVALGWFNQSLFTSKKPTSNQSSQTKSQIPNKIDTKIANKELTYTSWIPDWGSESGFESLKQNASLLDSISPVWYDALSSGELQDKTPKNSVQMLEFADQNGIEVIPSIACFDHEIMTQILQNQTNLDKHVENITKVVADNNFDGIDIDYESIKLSDKDKFFEFLEKLSAKLKALNKKLTIAVLAKWGDRVVYPGLRETREVQDWAKIAPLVDEIRLMTYDYTGAGSLYPGPIGPLEWQEEVLKYAITKAPKEKFVLGVHLYAYERWVEVKDPSQDKKFEDPTLAFKTDFDQQKSTKESMRSYTYQTVKRVLTDYPGQEDEYQGEKIYKYSKTNDSTGILENRVMVYIDPKGVQDRVNLARKYQIQGVAFWRIGADGELLKSLK